MKPVKTLAFTLSVIAILAGSMWLTPGNGIELGPFTFHMPAFSEMLDVNKVEYFDISEVIDKQFDIDSLYDQEIDSLMIESSLEALKKASYDSLVKSIHKIEFGTDSLYALAPFFEKLRTGASTRIMHYGDSQIEGDRITSFIRNRIQLKFGGSGPGLRPAVQPYDYIFSAVQENSANWKRYPVYGKVDSTVLHDRYGVLGAFSRFAPPVNDTLPFRDSVFYEAELSISKSDISYKKTKEYKNLRMFYGNAKRPVYFELIIKGEVFIADTLKVSDYAVFEAVLPDSVSAVSMKFLGFDSPDIYGIELAAKDGVVVDNIALRGSSGTIFTKSDYVHSLKMYNDLLPGLFILQFGGNVMPYIKNQQAIDQYGRWFTAQINRIKSLCPGAAIIVIGPSDMSTKEKDQYVTYEYLPAVVDALKNAALSGGCGYWDMYRAMGGLNSMPSWVNAEPELARPDYVHFSPRGARLIANMFYNALIFEYNNYLNQKKKDNEGM